MYKTEISINKKSYQVKNPQRFTCQTLAQTFVDFQVYLLSKQYSNVKGRVISI